MAEGDPLDRHRADVFCTPPTGLHTVVELQHSSIAEHEHDRREAFYARNGRRMFWLVDVHDEYSFNATTLSLSWTKERPVVLGYQTFWVMRWHGRSKQFIEKWKRSAVHGLLTIGPNVLYLATRAGTPRLHESLRPGEFAVCALTPEAFVAACSGWQPATC